MEFRFVQIDNDFYKAAVVLRANLFFSNRVNVEKLINDGFEKTSWHLICVYNEEVVGVGRLTILDDEALISQMGVAPAYQRRGLGNQLMEKMIEKCIELKVFQLRLGARTTAIDFYRQLGFVGVGDIYPSSKTGILHQKMCMTLLQ